MKQYYLFMISGIIGIILCAPAVASNGKSIGVARVYETSGDYETTRAFLLSAIRGRGLVVSRIGDVNAMLGRTAGAVGTTETVYRDAEVILFCKADLSHNLTAGNPHNIVLCPYAISIYETKKTPGTIYLSYRSSSTAQAEEKVIARLLDDIIHQAIDF